MIWLGELSKRGVVEKIINKDDAEKILKQLEFLTEEKKDYYNSLIRTKKEIRYEIENITERYRNIIAEEILNTHKQYAKKLISFIDIIIRDSRKEKNIEVFSKWFFEGAHERKSNNEYFVNSNYKYHEQIYANEDVVKMYNMYHIHILRDPKLKNMYKVIFELYIKKIRLFVERYNESILLVDEIVRGITSFKNKIVNRNEGNEWVEKSFYNSMEFIQRKALRGDIKQVSLLWYHMINEKEKKKYDDFLGESDKKSSSSIEIVTLYELTEKIILKQVEYCNERISHYGQVFRLMRWVNRIHDHALVLWHNELDKESKQLIGLINHIGYIRIYPEEHKGDNSFLKKYVELDKDSFPRYIKALQLIIDKKYAKDEQWNILQNGFKKLLYKNINEQYTVLNKGKGHVYECLEILYLLLSKKISEENIRMLKNEIDKVKKKIKRAGGIYVDDKQELIKKIYPKILQKIEEKEGMKKLEETIYRLIIVNTEESCLNEMNAREINTIYNKTFKIYKNILYEQYDGEVTDYLYHQYVEVIKSSSMYRYADSVHQKAYTYFIEYLYEKKYIHINKLADVVSQFLKKYYNNDKQKIMEIPLQVLYYLLYIYQRFLNMVVIVTRNKIKMKKYLSMNSTISSIEDKKLMIEIKGELFNVFAKHKEVNIKEFLLKAVGGKDDNKVYELYKKYIQRERFYQENDRSNLPFWIILQHYSGRRNLIDTIRYVDVIYERNRKLLPSLKVYLEDIKNYINELQLAKKSIKKEYGIEIKSDKDKPNEGKVEKNKPKESKTDKDKTDEDRLKNIKLKESELEKYYQDYKKMKEKVESVLETEAKYEKKSYESSLLDKLRIRYYKKVG